VIETLGPLAQAALFVAAALVVWFAGARLAGYADRIAEKTGLGRQMLGLLLLGGVTSSPEMAVGVTAALSDTPALSINDVLGSAAINLVILAIADAKYGRDALTSTPSTPDVLLQGTLGIILLAIVVAAITVGDRPVAGLGAWSWVLVAVFIGTIWIISNSQGRSSWVPDGPRAEAPDKGGGDEGSLRSLVVRTTIAAAAILVAGFVLARSGGALAESTGLGASFFGAVLLGLSTSLPEVSTVLAAVKLRRYDMAMADIFGSNLFNVIVIVVVDALYAGGPVLAEAGTFAAFGALLAIVLTAIYLVGLIERRDRTFLRMGFDSLAVLVVYAVGVTILYQLR